MGEMAEYYFYSGFDTDRAYFGDDPLFDRDEYWADSYDPIFYSRLAAKCNRCNVQFGRLFQSVSATAVIAREAGWQIDKMANGQYKWYCPKCKAVHDFEEVKK